MWSYRGLIAYAAGFAAEIPFMVLINVVTLKSYYAGPLAERLNSVDISWIVGAVVTAVVYWLLTRNPRRRRGTGGDRAQRRRTPPHRCRRRHLSDNRPDFALRRSGQNREGSRRTWRRSADGVAAG